MVQTPIKPTALAIDKDQARRQLELLGYKSGDKVYLTAFFPKGDSRTKGENRDKGRKAQRLNYAEVEVWQSEGRGVYLVVNGHGHSKEDVKNCRAIFYEHDYLNKDVQLTLWQALGLPEPTVQVDTGGKSIHSYWVFDEPIHPELWALDEGKGNWKGLQADLLKFADADKSLVNPNRVMRLAGCWYMVNNESGTHATAQSRIVGGCGKQYSYAELRKIIPRSEPPQVKQERLLSDDSQDTGEKLLDFRSVGHLLPEWNEKGRRGWATFQCPVHTSSGKGKHSDDHIHVNLTDGAWTAHCGCDHKLIYQTICEMVGHKHKLPGGNYSGNRRTGTSGGSDGDSPSVVGNATYQKTSIREVIAKAEQILKAQFNSQLDSIEASILLEELRREAGVNEYNWEQKYLKPLREKLERSLALPDTVNQPTDPTERKRLELKAIAQERDPCKFTDKLIEFCRRTGWTRRDVEQQIRLLKNSTVTPKAKRLKGKDFLALETESISWVFPGIIPSRGVFVIGGHAGAGKTTFAYDAVGSLLLGEEFLGESPVKTGKVLLVTGDELPCFTQDKLIDRGIPIENEDWEIILNWDVSQWDELEEAIADIRPALVIIDSFSSIHRDPSFDENSSQAKSTIYDLEALTNAYGCGCILIHHLSKSKENQGVAKLRGSSAISAAASVVCLMEQMSDGTRRLSFPKVRGAQTEPFLVTLDGSTGRYEVVSGGDDAGTKSLGERILAFLQKTPHKRFEQDEISEALGIPYTQKDSVYQALGRLFKRGLVIKRPSRLGGKRKVYGVSNPYSYGDNKACDTSSRNVTDTVTDKPQDTHPPSPLNVSVQIPESIEECGLELTDTLTDSLTDTKLTPQNDVHVVSDSNDDTVVVSAKLTVKKGQGCVSPLPVQTVIPDPWADRYEAKEDGEIVRREAKEAIASHLVVLSSEEAAVAAASSIENAPQVVEVVMDEQTPQTVAAKPAVVLLTVEEKRLLSEVKARLGAGILWKDSFLNDGEMRKQLVALKKEVGDRLYNAAVHKLDERERSVLERLRDR